MKKSVAILIINYKSTAMLSRCVEGIAVQGCAPLSIMILDNGNEDPIPGDYSDRFPSVQFHKSEKNIGFAAGNNLLLQHASDCEWIALVNPDAFLHPDWLEKMISAAMANPEYYFFASRLVQAANHEIIDGEGDTMHASGLVWREGHGKDASGGATQPREIFSPCAAAALYRRDAFESVGGFDEDFFCYLEDVDLGFRLRLAGYRCLLVPDAIAFHIGSATTGGQHGDFAVYHGHRNLVWTYVKNMPGALFWLLLPLHIALNIVTIIWFSLHGQGVVILKAKWDALCGMRRVWEKRRNIQRTRSVSIGEIWRVLDKRFLPLELQFWRRCL